MTPLSTLPWIRYCKASLLFVAAFFYFLVVFNNIFDYGSNLLYIENVLGMTETFSDSLHWRRLEHPFFHWVFYVTIILWELLSMVLCAWAGWKLLSAARMDAVAFQKAKRLGAVAYTVSLLQWYFAFITVGGEYFLMWQSENWNGQDAAFRMFGILGISLLFHCQRNDYLDTPPPATSTTA